MEEPITSPTDDTGEELQSTGRQLWEACRTGSTAALQELLLSASAQDLEHLKALEPGWNVPPLQAAAQNGHVHALDLLLSHGADANISCEPQLSTALTLAAAREGENYLECVRMLLGHGADINHVDWLHCSALVIAATAGNKETVKLLLSHGADKEDNRRDGRTPLLHAVQGRQVHSVKLLVQAGAEVDARSAIGDTPLMLAAEHGYCDIMKVLIGAGANRSAVNQYGCTALYGACKNGHEGAVRLLLTFPTTDAAAGADFLVQNRASGLEGLKARNKKKKLPVINALLDAGIILDDSCLSTVAGDFKVGDAGAEMTLISEHAGDPAVSDDEVDVSTEEGVPVAIAAVANEGRICAGSADDVDAATSSTEARAVGGPGATSAEEPAATPPEVPQVLVGSTSEASSTPPPSDAGALVDQSELLEEEARKAAERALRESALADDLPDLLDDELWRSSMTEKVKQGRCCTVS